MNEQLAKVKAWWAGLSAKQQKRAKVAAVFGTIILLAVLSNCAGN
jgi:hypothetical protein